MEFESTKCEPSDSATFVPLGKFLRQKEKIYIQTYIHTYFLPRYSTSCFTRSARCRALLSRDRVARRTYIHTYILVTNQRTRFGDAGPIASPIRRAIRNHRWHGASSGCWQRAPPVNAGCDENYALPAQPEIARITWPHSITRSSQQERDPAPSGCVALGMLYITRPHLHMLAIALLTGK